MARDDRKETDPRVAWPGHRERGPKLIGRVLRVTRRGRRRRGFTYQDVAEAAGVSLGTVRNAASRRGGRGPELDVESLESVVAYVARRAGRKAKG